MSVDSQAPKRDDVVVAYRVMLGRDPENEAIIAAHIQNCATKTELVRVIAGSPEFLSRIEFVGSPLFHYHANFDVRSVIRSHLDSTRKPMPGHYVNFLGVAIPTRVFAALEGKGGQLDSVPIPANFHADMAEWGASLRAVDLARNEFVMLELGCGWGCWMNNTGVAARNRGLPCRLVGVEADEKHLGFAQETLATNGFAPEEFRLIPGIASGRSGFALFPKGGEKEDWGSAPIFDATPVQIEAGVASGKYLRIKSVALEDAMDGHAKIDLLHMDIQGGEARLVEECIELITRRVGYLVIGTHSRPIEGRLFDLLLGAKWRLEIERPAIIKFRDGQPFTAIDGVQGWRNPVFHPQ